MASKNTPSCYLDTDRNISIIGDVGNAGISIDAGKAPNKTVSLCVGEGAYNLSSVVSPTGGAWTIEGSGISAGLESSETSAFYTPLAENITKNLPLKLRYTITVSGCNAYDFLSVYVKDNNTPPVLSGIPNYVCAGQKFKITASVPNTVGTYTYSFIDPVTKQVLSTTNPYELSIDTDSSIGAVSINSFNCQSSVVTAKLKTPFGTAGITSDKTVCNIGEAITYTFTGQSNSVFLWDFGDGVTGTIQNPVKYYYKSGDLTTKLKVISSLGCEKSFELPVRILGTEPLIITGNEPSDEVGLFPNPTKGILMLKGVEGIPTISVYNLIGQKFDFVVVNKSIDVSALASGMYVLKIRGNCFKFIKN